MLIKTTPLQSSLESGKEMDKEYSSSTSSGSEMEEGVAKSIYDKSFPLPSCASVGRQFIAQPRIKPKPIQLNVSKVNIDNIKERFQKQQSPCVSPFSKYKKESDDFIQGKLLDVQSKELLVSITRNTVHVRDQTLGLGKSPFRQAGHTATLLPADEATTFEENLRSGEEDMECNGEILST